MSADDTPNTTAQTLEDNILESIRTSGLLFSPHPNCDGWETTRAASPEIVAFTNKTLTPNFDRLAIEEDIVEAEDGDYEVRGYYIESHDRALEYEGIDFHQSLESAVSRVAEIMVEVVESREKDEEYESSE